MVNKRAHKSTGVVIDARLLRLGGLGTYTYNLIAGFGEHEKEFRLRAIVNQEDVKRVEPFCNDVAVSNAAMYTFREQLEIPWLARGSDLLHAPHYNAPLLFRGLLVVSIHDLIHITDPVYRRSASSWAYARPMLRMIAKAAKRVITVSDYSKTQIIELLGIHHDNVSTIYEGVSSEFQPCDREAARSLVSQKLGFQEHYVLYLGNLKPHKNVSTLFRAFANLRKRTALPHRLLIVGDDARWGQARREECAQLGIGGATQFVSHVPQKVLPTIYAGADLLVMPSTLEGFGLPVLEAMACGTPVICSRAASLPEVGGDAVLYFDPLSSRELEGCLERALSSRDLQENLRMRGLARAKLFDWSDCVRSHVNLYRELLGSN